MAASKANSGSKSGGSSKKKSSGGGGSALRNAVVGAVGADALLDIVERLGLVDLVVGRIKSRIEETDLDELLDDIADYLKRNPDVLVVGLAAVTVATGVVVYLNSRREVEGNDRGAGAGGGGGTRRVRAESRSADEEEDDD